ncbi:MAG: PepSY domain-containing protein [Polyangiaceae bacterium]
MKLMKKKPVIIAAAFATLTALGGTVGWVAEGTASADTSAKVSLVQARAIALRAVPGKIRKEELENEKGKQIYSFDINTGAKVDKEVNVDANTGTVVSIDDEDGD